jgi:hypothetical protein
MKPIQKKKKNLSENSKPKPKKYLPKTKFLNYLIGN